MVALGLLSDMPEHGTAGTGIDHEGNSMLLAGMQSLDYTHL
jgi:hypothetical protein